jgi:hypothetical protein
LSAAVSEEKVRRPLLKRRIAWRKGTLISKGTVQLGERERERESELEIV